MDTGLFSRLNQSRQGTSLLFCGAGFSADCLSFHDKIDEMTEIGAGAKLLQELNQHLQLSGKRNGFKDLTNCADEFRRELGKHALVDLLKSKYKITKTTSDMDEILNYPWTTIYTTNYDNSIDLSLVNCSRNFYALNNTQDPQFNSNHLPVIHLHGRALDWTEDNFDDSCVLSGTSYLKLTHVKTWLNRFRSDMERADIVVFVGFNASDFHLNEAIYDIEGLRDKVYFINRLTSNPDIDLVATQERYGHPSFIGRQGLADGIRKLLQSAAPSEPSLSSFARFLPPLPTQGVPKVSEIEDLLLFGKVDFEQLTSDLKKGHEQYQYHFERESVSKLIELMKGEKSVVLLIGEICDGKSLVATDISIQMSTSRPVFQLRHSYSNILDEVAQIINFYPNCHLIIENCFDIPPAKLGSIIGICAASGSTCLLTARNIAAEAEGYTISEFRSRPYFETYQLDTLDDSELKQLVELIDQFFPWSDTTAYDRSSKIRLLRDQYSANLPKILLGILNSNYVRDRYKEEYNKISSQKKSLKSAVISCLYIAHIGHDARIELISNAFEIDLQGEIQKTQDISGTIKLVHVSGKAARTVPAIGATNILKHMVEDRDIVDSVVQLLEHLAEYNSGDAYDNHIYNQIMRYSILSSVVDSQVEINRFFDNISRTC